MSAFEEKDFNDDSELENDKIIGVEMTKENVKDNNKTDSLVKRGKMGNRAAEESATEGTDERENLSTENPETPIFRTFRDSRWLRNDKIVNFMACDCVITTTRGRKLLNRNLIKIQELKIENPNSGGVIYIR